MAEAFRFNIPAELFEDLSIGTIQFVFSRPVQFCYIHLRKAFLDQLIKRDHKFQFFDYMTGSFSKQGSNVNLRGKGCEYFLNIFCKGPLPCESPKVFRDLFRYICLFSELPHVIFNDFGNFSLFREGAHLLGQFWRKRFSRHSALEIVQEGFSKIGFRKGLAQTFIQNLCNSRKGNLLKCCIIENRFDGGLRRDFPLDIRNIWTMLFERIQDS